MFSKPQTSTANGPQSPPSYDYGTWSKGAPHLCEFLSLTQWADGTSRVPGTLLILAEDGLWKASLHDREGQRSCWLSGKTPTDLMASLERVCMTGEADWRHKPVQMPPAKRKG